MKISETEIDWNKVPPFTEVLVRYDKDEEWLKQYFIVYLPSNNFKFHFLTSNKIGSDQKCGILPIMTEVWKYCKLANKEDIEKYRKKGENDEK